MTPERNLRLILLDRKELFYLRSVTNKGSKIVFSVEIPKFYKSIFAGTDENIVFIHETQSSNNPFVAH